MVGKLKQRATRCWRALSPLATISGNDLGKRLPRLQRQASYHGDGGRGGGGGGDVTLRKVKHQQTTPGKAGAAATKTMKAKAGRASYVAPDKV